jgi:hypothetical protein
MNFQSRTFDHAFDSSEDTGGAAGHIRGHARDRRTKACTKGQNQTAKGLENRLIYARARPRDANPGAHTAHGQPTQKRPPPTNPT